MLVTNDRVVADENFAFRGTARRIGVSEPKLVLDT